MNRGWMALAGLALVGLVGLTYWVSTWPEWLRTTTGPLDEAACARWRADAESADSIRAGWFEVYEGFAHLQGVCLPKDEARGRMLIERAMALRLNDRVVIDYVAALRAIGDEPRAREWAPFAALVAIRRETAWDWLDGFKRPFAGYDRQELEFIKGRGDVSGSRQRIESVLARPPVFPDLENQALFGWTAHLSAFDKTQGRVLVYRALRDGRMTSHGFLTEIGALEGAARCRHFDSIRTLARRFLSDDPIRPETNWIAGAVAWLDLRTGEDGELLAAVLRRQGRTLAQFEQSGDLARYEDLWRGGCTPLDKDMPPPR